MKQPPRQFLLILVGRVSSSQHTEPSPVPHHVKHPCQAAPPPSSLPLAAAVKPPSMWSTTRQMRTVQTTQAPPNPNLPLSSSPSTAGGRESAPVILCSTPFQSHHSDRLKLKRNIWKSRLYEEHRPGGWVDMGWWGINIHSCWLVGLFTSLHWLGLNSSLGEVVDINFPRVLGISTLIKS